MKDYEGIKYTKGASVFFVTGPSTFFAMLPYRPRTVQRCVRHVAVGSASHDQRLEQHHHGLGAATRRCDPSWVEASDWLSETGIQACSRRGIVSRASKPATNQQAKRLLMQFAVKREGNHSRWHVGNGTTRWAATCYKWSHGALINGRKYMDGRGQKRGRWLSSDKPSGLLGDIWC